MVRENGDHSSENSMQSTDSASSTRINRRRFLGSAATGTAVAMAGCSSILGGGGDGSSPDNESSAGEYDGETLRVMIWSGNYADRFEETIKPMYEEKTGANLQISRGWSDILAKIRSSPEDSPPFDVTITEGYFYYLGMAQDLFQPIRTENVPNLENVIDYYKEFRPTEYAVPVDGAPTTLIYRDDADFTPDSWSDFASETVSNSNGVGIDAGFWWFPQHDAAIAMDDMELAEEVYDMEKAMDVFNYMDEEWDITSYANSGEDIWQAFDNGVIDYAQWYYEQTAFDIDDYENLSHTAPTENSGFVNHWAVVRGSDKRDLGEHFLNFLLDSETQTKWSQNSPTLFTNKDMEYATEKLKNDLPRNGEEAAKIAWPDFEYIDNNFSELSKKFKKMQTQ